MVSAGQIIRASDVAVQGCRVNRTTPQSILDATTTAVTFDSEQFDTDGMHDTVTNNSRITINTAGIYTFGFSGELASAADYSRVVTTIALNGTTGIARQQVLGASTNLPPVLMVNGVYQFGVGDYIEVQIFQDNTASASRDLAVTADRSPEFYAARIGS